MLRQDRRARFVIQAQGVLDDSWASRFAWTSKTTVPDGNGGQVTTLDGVVADQAQLLGLLNGLVGLGLSVLTVRCTAEDDPASPLDFPDGYGRLGGELC